MFLENIYRKKTVLITGHTGFKGSWLSLWLKQLGATVIGVSLNIPSDPSHFNSVNLFNYLDDHRFDIRDADKTNRLIKKIQPDFIFHLAAQALVHPSYENPIETITTNVLGSVNILNSLRELTKQIIVIMITSDKVYDNIESNKGYHEIDRLGGTDPYSASKAMTELAIHSFHKSYFNSSSSNVRLGIARAGNVIGGGDWALDRIIPDCMKAWSKNDTINIRNPLSTRPWQHVLEPLSGYLLLGAKLYQSSIIHGEAYNFGPPSNQNYSVSELINQMCKYWDNVCWKDVSKSHKHKHEATFLKLNCDKAFTDINWMATLKFEETVRMTIEWYKAYYENKTNSMHDFTISQIIKYSDLAKKRNIHWAK